MARSIFAKLFSRKKKDPKSPSKEQIKTSQSHVINRPLPRNIVIIPPPITIGPRPMEPVLPPIFTKSHPMEAMPPPTITKLPPTETIPPSIISRSTSAENVSSRISSSTVNPQPDIFNESPLTPSTNHTVIIEEETLQHLLASLSTSAERRSPSAQDDDNHAKRSDDDNHVERSDDGNEAPWHTGTSWISVTSSVSSLHYSIFGEEPGNLFRDKTAHKENVPDLSGQVEVITHHTVFEGTYSSVYVGSYKGEKVAIKVMRGIRGADSMRRKIRREARTWWALDHPNILPFYGFDGTEGFGFGEYGALISPWCENGNASTYLSHSPPSYRRVELFGDVARGLLYLHQFTPVIVHGDLKPANVLIDEYHRAKLCDFGLVHLIQEDGHATGTTTTTAHTGTARYLPYELIETDRLPNTASDVYSLACMGLDFIYLVTPYAHIQHHQAGAHYKICRDIIAGIPPAPRLESLDSTITEFWDLLEECWSIRADTRPTTEGIVLYLENHSQDLVRSLSS